MYIYVAAVNMTENRIYIMRIIKIIIKFIYLCRSVAVRDECKHLTAQVCSSMAKGGTQHYATACLV